jgi:hypothetical protein
VLQALLVHLERRRQHEDGLSVLDAGDPTRDEGPAVADPLHAVDDRHLGLPGPQEVAVQRVDRVRRIHGATGRHEGLSGDLAAEDVLQPRRRAGATEQVHLELLDVEHPFQRGHAPDRTQAGQRS